MKRSFTVFLLALIFSIGVMVHGGGLISRAWAETLFLATSWEDGQDEGWLDRVEYRRYVEGYFNTSDPPPECSARYQEGAYTGDYALMIAGYSRDRYAYCYYHVFDLNLHVVSGMKIGYWIYHVEGQQISVDGQFSDGQTIRDLGGQALRDQYGVPIHPALRQDPMNQWYYVEVDLTAAAGKVLDYLMFAFDNGGRGYIGPYRAYVDDLKIFIPDAKPICPDDEVPAERWRGEYYNNKDLKGTPATVRYDGGGFLDFVWGIGRPHACVPDDNFSVRWTRKVYLSPGDYEFTATADDGVRLWVDKELIIDQWHDQGVTTYRQTVALLEGNHSIKMEYYENGGEAVAQLSWRSVVHPTEGFFYNDPYNVPVATGDLSWYQNDPKTAEQVRDELALAADPSNGEKARAVRQHLAQGGRVVLLVPEWGNWGDSAAGWERPIATYANDYLNALVLRLNYSIFGISYYYLASFDLGVARVLDVIEKARKAGSKKIRIYGIGEGADVTSRVVAVMATPEDTEVPLYGDKGWFQGKGNPEWFEGGFGLGTPADIKYKIKVGDIIVDININSKAAPPADGIFKKRGGFYRYTGTYNKFYYGNKLVIFNRASDPVASGGSLFKIWEMATAGISPHDYRGVFSYPEFMATLERVLNSGLTPANTFDEKFGDGAYVNRRAGEDFDFTNVHWIPYIPSGEEMTRASLRIANNPPYPWVPTTNETAHVDLKIHASLGYQWNKASMDLEENASRDLNDPLPLTGGNGIAISSEQVGIVAHYNFEDGNRYYSGAYPSESYPSKTLYAPFLAKGWYYGRNGWRQTTEMILSNATSQTGQVEITYYNGTPGVTSAERKVNYSIWGNATLRLRSDDLPNEWSTDQGTVASAVIRSDVPLSGMVRNLIGEVGRYTGYVYTQYGESNYRLFATQGSGKIFAPFLRVTLGTEWDEAHRDYYESFLFVQNTSPQEVAFTIRLQGAGASGVPIRETLPPFAMKMIALTEYTPVLFWGSAVLQVDSPSCGTLAIVSQLTSVHGAEANEGIPEGIWTAQKRSDTILFPLVQDQRVQADTEWDTEINVVNMWSTIDGLSIKYHQPDGKLKYTSMGIVLQPGMHEDFAGPGYLPDPIPPEKFEGSAVAEIGGAMKRLGATVEIRRVGKQNFEFHDTLMGYSAWW